MTADAPLAALRSRLVATAGGYLRNLVTDGTCSRCYTPIAGSTMRAPMCSRCRRDDDTDAATGLPDARGFMTYASHHEPIAQSGRLMRDYKSPIQPSASAQRTIKLLAALALQGHRDCPRALVGTAPTAWAVVPSLPPKAPDHHPLARILRSFARTNSSEIDMCGVGDPESPRDLCAAHFAIRSPIPRRAHVLLIEDTWTSGGHAQSAALALRAAGAEHVSLLALARWLTPEWGATTTTWMKNTLSGVDYDPSVCPWTQSSCPT
ncbi:MAG TPA: hypothetical protein VGD67_06295 [Pseudonocardiaceae bacterium]